ncbi:MAG: Alpha-L-rhamnosidase, partial [Pedosphaera sp.]|nr:Alpha-L-rhamnosidase [Pedosphaera sp.]
MKLKTFRQTLLATLVSASVMGGTATAAPVIITNTLPVTGSDIVGSQAIFTAAFSGAGPITYQWQVNKGGGPVNIPGATTTTLTLTNLQLADTGSYRLWASNASGATSSAARPFTVNPVPAPTNNVVVATATQTGLGANGTNFTPTWTVTPESLIAGQSPSSIGTGNFGQYGAGVVAVLTDGTYGTFNYIANVGGSASEVTCGGSAGRSVTYTLPASANGYDLTNIVVCGGWGDAGRDQQAYTIYYSTIAAPANFIQLKSISFNPSNPANVQSATRVTITPSAAGPLARSVAAVMFDFTTPAPENGYCGYSEISLFGSPSSNPPVANLPTSSPASPVSAGTFVTLNEAAVGVQPMQYQWQTDSGTGGGNYTDIGGASGSNYLLNTTWFASSTVRYRVQVTDINGSAMSPAISLTITNTNALSSAANVGKLRCEHLQDPLGIDVRKPRLSWQLNSTQRGDHQFAYQVLVASSLTALSQDQGDLWNSGQVISDQSVLVEYAGQTLTTGEACYWKVRIWDQNGKVSAWSSTAQWSMGLLNSSDWSAKWIGMTTATNITPAAPSPMLRKTFAVAKPVARATAYVCGLGYYELQLNGGKVGDHVLDPNWTRYDLQASFVTYDVTTNLVQGQNAMGVQLANGFYNQWATDAWNTYTAPWRALPQMILQLVIEYTDGSHDLVISDQSWKASTGPLLLDATRLGEVYDARLEKPGWATAGYNDSAWASAILREGIAGPLIAPDAEPVKVMKNVNPVKIIPVSGRPGVYTLDFGQNLVGWGRLTINGPAGTSVRMVYGEKTNSDGSVDQSNINIHVHSQQQYFQTDTYILKGAGTEIWEPRFTYHGFQYAQVEGLPAAPT